MMTTMENKAATNMGGDCVCELCEGAHHFADCPSHACTGDNCYCIGGDENFDILWDDSIVESLKEAR